jgi:hypothetical protein
VKHFAFHRALASSMTYTQFVEPFSTIGFHLSNKSTFYKFQKDSAQNPGWFNDALRIQDNNKKQFQNELRIIVFPILVNLDTKNDFNSFACHGTTPSNSCTIRKICRIGFKN